MVLDLTPYFPHESCHQRVSEIQNSAALGAH